MSCGAPAPEDLIVTSARSLSSGTIEWIAADFPASNGMEWIDFKLELHGDPEGIYKPLVRAWWEGRGFVGKCPNCQGWVRFTTLKMEALDDNQATQYLQLPENWTTVAQFA